MFQKVKVKSVLDRKKHIKIESAGKIKDKKN